MGSDPGDGSGIEKDFGRFGVLASQVICRVCPDPLYSDEARKTKLQGSVMLSVLVGADGRVKDVRMLSGIGMGLDENAWPPCATGNSFPRKTPPITPSLHGLKSKRSSAFIKKT